MKHAYLIIAHNEWGILQKLVSLLDDERNDIYIHFDAKVKKLPELSASHSDLIILQNRIEVHWADFSMVEVELSLLESAFMKDGYDYFHLLSGVDLPIKSQDYIHDFFTKNNGKEFVDYCLADVSSEMERKMQLWHLFPSDFKNSSGMRFIKRPLRALSIRLQLLVGFRRNKNIVFKKGSQWFSITAGFVKYLLERKDLIRDTFTHTFCPDEVFVQTMCWNSPFKDRIYDISDNYMGHMRMIDWGRGRPYVWQNNDFDEMVQSDRLFARKFSDKYMGIVDRLVELVSLKKK